MGVHESDRDKNNSKRKIPGRLWPDWYAELATFRKSDTRKATWQLINTIVPYCGLWYLMIRSIQLDYPYTFTLILALPAAAFMVRLFILFHDCVHGSFFRRQNVNTFFGYILGVLVFTPFEDWRFAHLRHHVTYANLDARGFGDIWTMTLTEYENVSKKKRLQYRLYRNPVVMLGLGALFMFLLRNRLPTRWVKRKERTSVIFTNLLIIVMVLVADRFIGWRTFLLIQLPVLCFAGAAGIWLFFVQHQFPGGYWARKGKWEPLRAAMEGCSFYNLPALLRWFSSNIGYHHVHHLSPRIPNYRLKKCYDAVPALQEKAPLTIAKSLSCIRLKMWDEQRQKMVDFP
ncbi:MAG: fatty acid desaturase [Deltaproteobacteria bacterium]|nr:fatty acid desaturase [Deltaproteobacteria bacterium]